MPVVSLTMHLRFGKWLAEFLSLTLRPLVLKICTAKRAALEFICTRNIFDAVDWAAVTYVISSVLSKLCLGRLTTMFAISHMQRLRTV